jgi:hypothetical protein
VRTDVRWIAELVREEPALFARETPRHVLEVVRAVGRCVGRDD